MFLTASIAGVGMENTGCKYLKSSVSITVATPTGFADLTRESIRLKNVGKDLPNFANVGNDPFLPAPSCGGGGEP